MSKENTRSQLKSLVDKIGDKETDPKTLQRGIWGVFKVLKTPETKQITIEVRDDTEINALKEEVNDLSNKLKGAECRASNHEAIVKLNKYTLGAEYLRGMLSGLLMGMIKDKTLTDEKIIHDMHAWAAVVNLNKTRDNLPADYSIGDEMGRTLDIMKEKTQPSESQALAHRIDKVLERYMLSQKEQS